MVKLMISYDLDKSLKGFDKYIDQIEKISTHKKNPVLVTGFVMKPGGHKYSAGYSIMDYVALSGGATDMGSIKNISIIRGGEIIYTDINQVIDQFVNKAFFADISVSRVLEIHMELMDEFSQQLKLEGRSEEILLDYRLTIIDILAHLGEMYRRSIPRGDVLFDLLNQID